VEEPDDVPPVGGTATGDDGDVAWPEAPGLEPDGTDGADGAGAGAGGFEVEGRGEVGSSGTAGNGGTAGSTGGGGGGGDGGGRGAGGGEGGGGGGVGSGSVIVGTVTVGSVSVGIGSCPRAWVLSSAARIPAAIRASPIAAVLTLVPTIPCWKNAKRSGLGTR
jgi:hypothetical protein